MNFGSISGENGHLLLLCSLPGRVEYRSTVVDLVLHAHQLTLPPEPHTALRFSHQLAANPKPVTGSHDSNL